MVSYVDQATATLIMSDVVKQCIWDGINLEILGQNEILKFLIASTSYMPLKYDAIA